MTAREVHIIQTIYHPAVAGKAGTESVQLVFQHPDLPADSLPVAHVIPQAALVDRAVHYGLDHTAEGFHELVIEHMLHEGIGGAGVHPEGHAQHGQVHDVELARGVTAWVFLPAHAATLRQLAVEDHHIVAHPEHQARLRRAQVADHHEQQADIIIQSTESINHEASS